MNYLFSILLLLLLSSCDLQPQSGETELYQLMNGTYTSERQSVQDSSFHDITIHLSPIWKEKEDLWIYAEQALSDAKETPYNQRIYKIFENEQKELILEPYDLENPEEYVGQWQNPAAFDSLQVGDLLLQKGCELFFVKEEEGYVGETRGRECGSLSSTSAYSTTRFIVSEDRIMNWARGFDENDNRVWGKENGGYVYDKVE